MEKKRGGSALRRVRESQVRCVARERGLLGWNGSGREGRGTPGLLALTLATPPGPHQTWATGKGVSGFPCGSVFRCASPFDEVLGVAARASLMQSTTY